MQRYNALDVLMQNAAKAGDQVWAAIDCEVKSSDEQ
jgi:hypothetical protein